MKKNLKSLRAVSAISAYAAEHPALQADGRSAKWAKAVATARYLKLATRPAAGARRFGYGVHRDEWFVYQPGHPRAWRGWVRRAVIAYEQASGRPLQRRQSVAFINGDRSDCRPGNLYIRGSRPRRSMPARRSAARFSDRAVLEIRLMRLAGMRSTEIARRLSMSRVKCSKLISGSEIRRNLPKSQGLAFSDYLANVVAWMAARRGQA